MAPVVPRVSVSWTSTVSDDAWKSLTSSYGVLLSESWLELGTALPAGDDPRSVRAEARRRGDLVRWSLAYRPAPNSEPPPFVRDLDKKLGGPDGLAALLARVASTSASTSVDLRLSFELSAKEYSTILIPASAVPPEVLAYSPEATIEQVGYRFGSAPFGIAELVIMYEHSHAEYSLNVLASAIVGSAIERSVPLASRIASHITETFFAPLPGKEERS